MEKKKYFSLWLDLIRFSAKDVLTESSGEAVGKDIFDQPEGYNPWGN